MGSNEEFPLYTSAIVIPALALFAILLDLPPAIWHISNRNIGAASLIVWLIALNMINFLNALIWPRDNLAQWYHGQIYCDIQVRLLIGAVYGGLPGATICIMKALAKVLDTRRTVVNLSTSERRRQYLGDGLLCFGLPVLFMLSMYVVHTWRYVIYGISGCDAPLDMSWVTVVLLMIWPPIFMIVASYYAGLVIFRLHRYRSQISGVLTLSKTTRSRFLRLFAMAVLVICLLLPAGLYQLAAYFNISGLHRYSWSAVHDDWKIATLVPAYGLPVHWDRWMWIACGYIVFLFFGLGSEARSMYRKWLVALGFAKVFPSLLEKKKARGEESETKLISTWFGSMGSKARMFFARKSTPAGTGLDSFGNTSTLNDSFNNAPRKSTFRLSNLSSASKQSKDDARNPHFDLPTVEPSHKTLPKVPGNSKWSIFANMPTFAQAFAGVQPKRSTTTSIVPRIHPDSENGPLDISGPYGYARVENFKKKNSDEEAGNGP